MKYFDTQSSKASYRNFNPLQDCRKHILNGTEAPPLLVFHLHLQRHLSTEEEPTGAPLRETNQSQAVSVLQPAQLKKKRKKTNKKYWQDKHLPQDPLWLSAMENTNHSSDYVHYVEQDEMLGLDPLPVRWEPRPHPRQIGPIIGLPSTSTASQISPNKS